MEESDQSYFTLRECDSDQAGTSCSDEFAVRHEEETRTVVVRRPDGGEIGYGFHFGVCDFGQPFWSMEDCESSSQVLASGFYGATANVGGSASVLGTWKGFSGIGGTMTYLSGLGLVKREPEQPNFEFDITFARVSGVSYGTPAFFFPTDEAPASEPHVFALGSVYPNPARDAATVTYTLDRPQQVTFEIVDVLGRVVHSETEVPHAAGPHEVRLDLCGLQAGFYLLRLRGDEAEATRRFVVVR